MSDVLNLGTINLDILLEIVQHGLSPLDLLNLRLTCKAIHAFISTKAPWIVLLQQASQLRPLPLPPYRKLSDYSLVELIGVAFKSDNLNLNWMSPHPEARPGYKMVSFAPTDVIVSILLIPHSPFVLTLSVGGGAMRSVSWITCVDTERGRKVAQYRSPGLVSSWRAEMVSENVVIIALLIGPEDRASISPEIPASYNVLRLKLPEAATLSLASFHNISSHFITSAIMGMFLTCEVAGLVSVLRPTQTSGLLMTRFRDGTTAHIDSGVSVTKPNLNIIANESDLILYTEDNLGAAAYAYSFADDLHPLFSPSPRNAPQVLIHVPPSTVRSYKFHPTELCDGSNNAYTIIRSKWKDLASGGSEDKSTHSEISVLSMAFVLGVDPNGLNDHRCISHMYLDPFSSPDDDCTSDGTSTPPSNSSGSSRATPDVEMEDEAVYPAFSSPRPTLTSSPPGSLSGSPSPTVIGRSLSADSCKKCERTSLIRRTFHSCLEDTKDIWQGPSRNDLISVGIAASHAVWVAASTNGDLELKLASFEEPPSSLPVRTHDHANRTPPQGVVTMMEDGTQLLRASGEASHREGSYPPKALRTLKLPMSIHAKEISALALDDVNGIIALATTRSELWLLDYAVAPSALRVPIFT